MAIAGDLRVFATLPRHHSHPLRCSTHSSFKLDHSDVFNGGLGISSVIPRNSSRNHNCRSVQCQSNLIFGVSGDGKRLVKSISQDAETFLLNAINMNFFERLNLAWKIIFPPRKKETNSSNAMIAKQRLKMILFSDRCEVSEEAKRKIVTSVVSALSDYVIIESKEKVELSVSAGEDLGTVYSVTVPVRRVRPEYQEEDGAGSIMNAEYMDDGETSGSVDVRFDFYVPGENSTT